MTERRMLGAVLLMAVVGCSGGEGPGKAALECSEGARLELSTTDVCVYRDPLLVETGFSCPAEATFGSSYGDLVVCSPEETLPDDFFDKVAEQYPGDVPNGACMSTVCSLGEACDAGTCVPHDDTDPDPTAVVEVTPASLDFGEVSQVRPVTRSLTVSNPGDAALELSNIRVDAPFSYDGAATRSVEAGGSTEIEVSLANDGNQREAEVSGELNFTTNDATRPDVTVALRGNLLFEEPLCGDVYEPNDFDAEATEATTNTEYDAVLCLNDEDWWAFDLTEPSDHTMSVTGPVALDGVAATLYAFVNGVFELTPHSRLLSGVDDSITARLAPGRYAWRLEAPATPVAYAITLGDAAAVCTADMYESNDTMASATNIVTDTIDPYALSGSLCGADVDWVELQDPVGFPIENIAVGRFIEVAVTSFWSPAPALTLHGPAGPVAATSIVAGEADWRWEQLTYEVDVEGEYHVEIDAPAGDVLQYRIGGIVRSDSSCDADVYEPNDDAGSAALLAPTPGDLLQVSDVYICDGDEDWYAFDLSGGRSILLNVGHSPAASFAIEIYKEGESTPRAVDIVVPTSTDNLEYAVPAGDGGRYLARISNQVPGSSAKHYLLSVITN